MDPTEEMRALDEFLSGSAASWEAIVDRYCPALIAIAEHISWPPPEANELARWFLNEVARIVVALVAKTREITAAGLSIALGHNSAATSTEYCKATLSEHFQSAARTICNSAAATTEDIEAALADHFQAFAGALWNGQSLATDILARKPGALDLLCAVYSRTMARWLLENDRRLSKDEAQALANDFLADKVVLRQAPMLKKVAAEGRPLRPRLIASLGTFLVDIHRKDSRERAQVTQLPTDSDGKPIDITDEYAVDPAGEPGPADTWADILARLRAQLAAIRQIDWQPGNGSAAHRQALLLSERVLFLQWTRDSYGTVPADGITLDCIAVVERAIAWCHEENAACIGPTTLQDAWKLLAEQAMACNVSLEADDFGSAIKVATPTWFQWLSRGRAAVLRRTGPSITRYLFPHWPRRAARRDE